MIALSKRINPDNGDPLHRSSSTAQINRNGKASATRQKALANGPTSAKRTNTGEIPIATAPKTSAAKAGAKDSEGFDS